MHYVIVDLEATCWEKSTSPSRMEIIEIGAVSMPSAEGEPDKEFARFVRPVIEPILSDFCTRLTSIQQADVDKADTFPTVFADFLAWIGGEPYNLCSWGAYDFGQFRTDCQRHQITFPDEFANHINLKQAFAQWKSIKPCGMKAALGMLNIPMDGQHHRGIDDARNIAKIARILLSKIET